MPLLIVKSLMSVSIVVPVRLGGIDAAGFMLLLIAPPMWGSIVDPFGNLLATGFGPSSSQIGLDDIVILKLPKNFQPALIH